MLAILLPTKYGVLCPGVRDSRYLIQCSASHQNDSIFFSMFFCFFRKRLCQGQAVVQVVNNCRTPFGYMYI